MGSKGSNTTTTSTTTAPNPEAMSLYQDILARARTAADTPYQSYSGQRVADLNSDQQSAFQTVRDAQGNYQPYLNQAAYSAGVGSSPITSTDIARYTNPWQNQVVNATMANLAETNEQQRQGLVGNAIASGAFGGDRAGVAQAELARQQGLANGQTLAGLQSQGFNTALGAAQADRSAAQAGASQYGNLAGLSMSLPFSGANQLLQAGNQQQQQAQNELNVPYQNFLEQRSYPFQTTQWLAGVGTGVGSQMGGTSNGTQTSPAPNLLNSIIGGGLALAGLKLKDGGRVPTYADGGITIPYGASVGWVPSIGITPGHAGPNTTTPQAVKQQDDGSSKVVDNAVTLAGKMQDYFKSRNVPTDIRPTVTDPSVIGDIASGQWSGADPIFRGIYARGGEVMNMVHRPVSKGIYVPRHFADGGDVDDADQSSGFGAMPFQGLNLSRLTWPWNSPASNDASSASDQDGDKTGTGDTIPLPRPRPASLGQPVDDSAVQSKDVAAEATRNGFFNLTPEAKTAMIAAGLGMMASKSPYVGVALGEGGLRGLESYSAAQKAKGEQSIAKQKADLEAKKLAQQADQYASDLALRTRAQDEKGQMTDYQKELLKQNSLESSVKLRAPIKIGETVGGAPIMAMPQINQQTNSIDLYPIRPDGTISQNPLKPGDSIRGVRPTGDVGAGTDVPQASDTMAPPVEIRAQAAPASPSARDDGYLDRIAKEDPAYAAKIKGIADYQISPNSFSIRNNRKERVLADVLQYDPTYDQRRFASTSQAIKSFATGKQGDNLRSFNVLIEHLDTLDNLGKALQNGDTQVLNSLRNTIKTSFGYDAPPNFEAGKLIVGDEIAKAVIGGQNAEADRRTLQAQLKAASSPAQLRGVIGAFKELMAGQVTGLRKQYEDATGLHNFDDRLTDSTKHTIQDVVRKKAAEAGAQSSAQRPAIGTIFQSPTHGKVRWNGTVWQPVQ